MMDERRLTRHNGRFGKNGVYNSKHNDRRFPVENSEHIDPTRTPLNIYWDCYNGVYHPGKEQEKMPSFEQVEEWFYEETFSDYCEKQNARNEAHRHPEKNRSTYEIWRNKKTCPEESIYQMGTLDNHESAEDLFAVFEEFHTWFQDQFGSHIRPITWALHMDESTPHIHEKHVFVARNKYGETAPMQEEALAQLGFERPDPDSPKTKQNNRKVAFDAFCRVKLFEIAKAHGLHFAEKPEYGGRDYLEKQEYILMKQKEQLAEQKAAIEENEDHLEELTMKISDIETFANEITNTAYEKAIDVIAATVQQETHNADLRRIKEYKEWVCSPKSKVSKKEQQLIIRHMNDLIDKIKESVQRVTQKIRSIFHNPEKKLELTKPIRRSILADLKKHQILVDTRKTEPKALQKRNYERGL